MQLLTKLQYNNNNAGYPGISRDKEIQGYPGIILGRHTHELLQQGLARDRNRDGDGIGIGIGIGLVLGLGLGLGLGLR